MLIKIKSSVSQEKIDIPNECALLVKAYTYNNWINALCFAKEKCDVEFINAVICTRDIHDDDIFNAIEILVNSYCKLNLEVRLEMLRLFLNRGAVLEGSAMSSASVQNTNKFIKLFIEYGMDANFENGYLLYGAALKGTASTVHCLLKNGCKGPSDFFYEIVDRKKLYKVKKVFDYYSYQSSQ